MGPLNWSSEYEKREERLSVRKALAFTQQHRVQIKQWHSLTLNTEYSRRRRRFPEEPASEERTDLADIDVRFSPLKGAIVSEVHYQLTSKGASKKLKNYLYVGKDKGYYIWEDVNGDGQKDESEFIPDPNGDYILYIEEIGESQPVTELDSGLRLALEPRKILSEENNSFWNKILKELSSHTSFQVQRKTSRDGSEGDALRDRSVFQQDISLFGRSQKLSLYLKHRNCRDLSNEYYGGSDRYSSLENSVKIRSRFLPKSVVELEYIKERTDRKGKGIFANYQIDSHKLRGEFSHRPVAPLELWLRLKLGKDWEVEKRTKATWISLTPGFSYRLRGKGKFWTQLNYANVHSNETLIYQMAEGKRKGTNLRWNTNFDYRLSQYTSFSFSYYGRKQPKRETIHSLKAEMRAY
ncbi:MAG: hypothetical protein KAT86_00630, partial [Candidatus Latescibacteria bacterium]|nr:hypothetical protein [Candidatus Latescibacterota bacterium]